MNKCIVWKRKDGGIAITYPNDPRRDEETESGYIDRIAKGAVPVDGRDEVTRALIPCAEQVAVLPRDAIPSDRDYRAAWAWFTEMPKIDIDMTKARTIKLGLLRAIRDEKLKAMDIEYTKALESKDAARQEAVATVKQQLRDMPQTIGPLLDACNTLDDLRRLMPDELK